TAIRCYRCALQPLTRTKGQEVPPCSGELAYVECPFSTFCMKRRITWELGRGVTAIRCYRCALQPLTRTKGQEVPPCSGELAYVECPFSTFCMKRRITWELGRGVWINSTIRDCAKQLVPERVYQNGELKVMFAMDPDAYIEGCVRETHPLRQTSTEYCFCQNDLCNSSPTLRPTAYATAALLLLPFLFLRRMEDPT
ncbi:unnamed protein product, partial [Cyprideis torosa]